jgi:signal transduction histidine kinase
MPLDAAQRDSTIPPEPDRYAVVHLRGDDGEYQDATRVLGARGYRVGRASTTDDVLDHLGEWGPVILLAEVGGGGAEDGLETARRVRQQREDVEVLLTGDATADVLLRGIDLGVFRFLRKPFRSEDLVAAVAGAANRLFLRIDRRRRIAELEQRNHALEETLARLQESEARRTLAERLASVGQFASALGHEMNGPLAYVQTNLDLVRGWVPALALARDAWREGRPWDGQPEDRRELLDAIIAQLPAALDDCNTGLRFMRRLSRDLGAMARYQQSDREPFDLNEVVQTACRIAKVKVRRPHRLEVGVAPEPVVVLGSPGRLAQVVMNLVANAADASRRDRPNRIDVETERVGDQAVLRVRDRGVGIPAPQQARIFEPYVTFREGGTGIGLGVVRQIVDEHGGRIELDSEVGRGSEFRVLLPSADIELPGAAGSSSHPPGDVPAGTILLVDDDPLIRRGLERALTGYRVRSAENGEEALAILDGERPDLVVTDVDMPGLDGLALYQEALRRHPGLVGRFLFVTGHEMSIGDELEASVLKKPFGARALQKAVLKALSGR